MKKATVFRGSSSLEERDLMVRVERLCASAMHTSALSKDRATAAKKRAEAAHEIAAQANTLFAPNLSHRKETTSKEAANEAVNAP